MVQTEQMQNRGVEVGHRDFLVLHIIAEFVRLAVRHTTADAATSQPDAEGVRMMIAAVCSLSCRSATEFGAKDDERVVEQTA